jgi:hypothetical protein
MREKDDAPRISWNDEVPLQIHRIRGDMDQPFFAMRACLQHG